MIVDRALAGKRVARFKGGDSFVFGRGYEEIEACQAAGVPVTVVPGISSPLAVPAVAGIPVTHRGVAHEFTVVSGHLAPGHPDSLVDWDVAGPAPGHGRADDGRRERAGDRRRHGGRRPRREDAGRDRLRRHDAGGADGADHAWHDRRRHHRRAPYGRRPSWWSATWWRVAHPQRYGPPRHSGRMRVAVIGIGIMGSRHGRLTGTRGPRGGGLEPQPRQGRGPGRRRDHGRRVGGRGGLGPPPWSRCSSTPTP